MSSTVKLGLIVTAKPTYYPIELSNSELLAHYETIQEYHQEISANVIAQSTKFKPDHKLIDQQPDMNPLQTRNKIVTFLFELSVMTRVTNGVFFHAVRLYDRYCSKRVVLKDQAELVVGSCLWLAAKTWGGCNHIINNVSVPTGGRFYGPNPRARIPRLSELVHYCGGSDVFDESMFIQMERHILDTLNWDVYESMINDYILNVDENCLIQYELYKNQLKHNAEWKKKRQSQASNDSDATVDENVDMEVSEFNNSDTKYEIEDEDEELKMKVELINLKRFLIDLSCWQYDLLKYELFEVSNSIFSMINKFTNQDQGPLLSTPVTSNANRTQIMSIFVNAVINAPKSLLEIYGELPGIYNFIMGVKEYHSELQKKLNLASAMDLHKRIPMPATFYEQSSNVSSPTYSSNNYTPMRNISAQSDNSIFSTNFEQSSPITPQMYHFNHYNNDAACGSSVSVDSLPHHNQNQGHMDDSQAKIIDENKENKIPIIQQGLPRAKFINDEFCRSNYSSSSNRSSVISLGVRNSNTIL